MTTGNSAIAPHCRFDNMTMLPKGANKTMNLTPAQREAIESDHPDIAVIAGPGSGKTEVLTQRATRLINAGASPRDMVLITFTNAAAREIEARLRKGFFEEQPVPFSYAGTLHGFMLAMLKLHGRLIGLPQNITMLNEDEAHDLLIALAEAQGVKCSQADLQEALTISPEFYLFDKPERLSKPQCVAAAYYRQQLEAGVMDFDGLLRFGICLLKRSQPTIPYLFWDEVQDGGAEDWNILAWLKQQCGNCFVVGDPDQSIYGFRGARPDLFLNYLRDPQRKKIMLEANFRSLPEICRAANALIRHNGSPKQTISYPKVSTSDNPEGDVERWTGFPDSGELMALVKEIRTQPDPNECAVLVRTNALAERIAKALQAFSIPVATKEVVDKPPDWGRARAYIALLEHPFNDLLAYWWVVREQGKKAADAAKLMGLKSRRPICEYLATVPRNATVCDLPTHLGAIRIGPEAIAAVQKAIETLRPDASLAELSFALADEELHRKEVGAGVTVTTIHSAKGREWDCVYLPAFEQGIIPSLSKNATIEEERRLAFVAFTRARRLLVVSNAFSRVPQWGNRKPQPAQPSQFIGEAGLSITGE